MKAKLFFLHLNFHIRSYRWPVMFLNILTLIRHNTNEFIGEEKKRKILCPECTKVDIITNSIYPKMPPLKYFLFPSIISIIVTNFLFFLGLLSLDLLLLSIPQSSTCWSPCYLMLRLLQEPPWTGLLPPFSSLSPSTHHAPGLIFQTWCSSQGFIIASKRNYQYKCLS